MKKPSIGVYIRVSTLEQANKGFGKDLQLSKIKTIIQYHADSGYAFDERFLYQDLGVSGDKDADERPGLLQMKEDIRDGKINTVMVWKLDRLARRTTILLDMVDFFNYYDVTFISTEEKVDTKSPNGTFFLTVIGALAQMERALLAEKLTAGKIEATKQGYFVIGGSPVYGFKKNKETRLLELVPEEKIVIQEIFNLYVNQKKSISEISKILTARAVGTSFDTRFKKERKDPKNKGKWVPTHISQILSNETYIGKMWLNRTMKKEYTEISEKTGREVTKSKRVPRPKKDWLLLEVEPIVGKNIFDKAQEILITNKYRFNNNNKPIINHLFAGIIKCGVCGGNYKAYREKDKSGQYKIYYRCTRSHSGKFGKDRCLNSQVREEFLTDSIYSKINDIIRDPKNIVEKYMKENDNKQEEKKYQQEINENIEKIASYYKTVNNLYDSLVDESNMAFKGIIQDKINKHRDNIENLEARNVELESFIKNRQEVLKNSKEIVSFARKMKNKDVKKFSREDQIKLIHLIIQKILITVEDVQITFIFGNDDDTDGGNSGGNPENNKPSNSSNNKKGSNLKKGNLNLTGGVSLVGPRGIEPRLTE